MPIQIMSQIFLFPGSDGTATSIYMDDGNDLGNESTVQLSYLQ